MKLLILITLVFSLITGSERTDTIHQYELNAIDGKKISLEQFKGNALLIVNTASECGFTGQYEGLQNLYEKYKDDGLVVLGFPANDFGGQEPGTDEEIAEFCEINFGVTFPLFSKISVKGDDKHPLFEQLTKAENPDFTGEIGWNFEKFLVDGNGNLVRRFKTNVDPMSSEITNALKEIL